VGLLVREYSYQEGHEILLVRGRYTKYSIKDYWQGTVCTKSTMKNCW
jgi:hypothetical protein